MDVQLLALLIYNFLHNVARQIFKKNEYLTKALYCLKTFKWLLIAFKITCQLFSATYILTFHDLVPISVSGIIYLFPSLSTLSLYNLCYYN